MSERSQRGIAGGESQSAKDNTLARGRGRLRAILFASLATTIAHPETLLNYTSVFPYKHLKLQCSKLLLRTVQVNVFARRECTKQNRTSRDSVAVPRA